MRVASLGFTNIIARIYIYIYILVGNLPCIEFVYRVLWAELQINSFGSHMFTMVNKNNGK